ncbi:MAG: hypothetical protein HUU55_21840 [Myxococcales bacterium]|nr:hypothetical protein [Myxococcales bacterium]
MNTNTSFAPKSRNSILPNRSGKAAGAVIAVVAIIAIAALVWFFVFRSGGGASGGMVSKYIPKDVTAYGGVDMAGLMSSDVYKAFKPQVDAALSAGPMKEATEKTGVTPEKISALAFAMGATPADMLVTVKGDLDAEKINAAMKEQMKEGFAEIDLEGSKFVNLGMGGYSFGDDGVMIGGTQNMVASALKVSKGGESVEKSADLPALAKNVDTGATFWAVGAVPKDAIENAKSIPMVGNLVGSVTHTALSVDVGSGLNIQLAVKMGSDDAATQAKTAIDGFVAMGKTEAEKVPDIGADLKKVIDGLKVEVSGSILKFSVEIDSATTNKFIEMAKKQGGLG